MNNDSMNQMTEVNERLRGYSFVNQENLENSYTGCDIFSYAQGEFGQNSLSDQNSFD